MYESKPGLINGDVVNDLLSLCNEWFINPFIQPYAGANPECMFCGTTQDHDGKSHHSSADCPVIHYQDIAKKYQRFITKPKEEQ
jgi:hypothetical protein